MKKYQIKMALISAALLLGLSSMAKAADKKVKVFIMAGQSNMEGHGQVRSLDHLGEHPKHGHLLKKLKNADGSWAVRNDVTISYQAEHRNKKNGPLTIGWGSEEHEIGPELMFGAIMGQRYKEHVLLIKTAWGGKSVWCDFRSPSAGEMTWDEKRILKRDNHLKPGFFYRKMVAEIKECLANIKDIVPDYKGQGYEIVGMAWFQGWNDFCEWHLQLDGKRVGLGLIDRYPHNLAAMFRDLRKDLDAPDMPIVIGELGVGGHEMTTRAKNSDDHEAVAMAKFRRAQKAVADDSTLRNITFVPTADFWDTRLQELRRRADEYWNEKRKKKIKDTDDNILPTKQLNDEYCRLGGHWYCHYNGSASNYSLIGYALAEALNTSSDPAQTTGDIVFADFEGRDYGGWKVTGNAFGDAPVKGSQAKRHTVSGFKGKGLVDTYVDPDGNFNDDNTGTLTSPEFTIERDYITFLIGGGAHNKTCMQLLVADKIVASSSGENDEKLVQRYFGVAKHKGKAAILRIVDDQKGGWAHINVDQIVQSNQKPKMPNFLSGQTKEMKLARKYILFPIQNGSRKARIDVSIDGRDVRQFDAEIALSKDKVSFWAFLDITAFKGKVAILKVNGVTREGMEMIVQSDKIPEAGDFYSEPLRPQFHFSQKIGWNNDGNGMLYYDGEWHLYFQHNPYGWKWGNMHWGHAVSKDLVHWEQLPIAIYNKRRGDWAFSGGGVVDENNSAGWQTGTEKVLIASWTSTGRGECIAYSNDRGRTFTEYEGNPVIKHSGRDPKIIWYEPGKHWVLVVYDHYEDAPYIAFYNSTNLKDWQFQSRLKGYYECPELFELPVDGDTHNTRWVVFAADARYAIGRFDGKTFTPDHEGKQRLHYGNYYASQLFSNTPDGRRIQVGWAQIAMHGMPFNQTFSFPHRLTLRTTDDGIRMFAEPVKEIQKIYKKKQTAKNKKLTDGKPARLDVSGDIFDVTATFAQEDAKVLGLDIGGNRIEYNAAEGRLQDAPLKPVDGKVTIRVLIDRPMMEIIGNHGRVYITRPRQKKGDVKTVEAFAVGGTARLVKIEVNQLESIWKK
ncbi:MAG: sialate O-acetylesterase [Planctomycetota bacterium]|jgi:fructan beta-fructosidase